MAADTERPVVGDIFPLAEFSRTGCMYMMSNLVKYNIGEQGVADGRNYHCFGALGNDVVDK
jgi:hypothetical protein